MRKRKNATSPNDQQAAPDLRPLLDVLRSISRSLAVLALRFAPSRHKTDKARVGFLEPNGFSDQEIADMLGSTPESVKQQRYQLRKEREARSKSGGRASTRGRKKVKARGRRRKG